MQSVRPAILLCALLAACGGEATTQSGGTGTPIGMTAEEGEDTSGGEAVPAIEGSVELALRRSDGTFIDVGELRGQPLLLVIIATFDGTSQMLIRPLREVAQRHPDLRMIGVAAEPSARLLVGPYENAISPPFPITYDPEETVREGASALGPIDIVPTLIVLNAAGVEVGRGSGFMRADAIEALLAPVTE